MATSAKSMDTSSNPLTLFAVASPARTSASRRERASASSATVQVSGRSLLAYSAKYGLDLHWLKMLPPFEVAGLPWFYKISGRSGLMRSGIVFRLAPLARLTRGTESLLSPTPKARSGKRSSTARLLPTLTASRWSGLQSHGVNVMLGPLSPEWCEWFMGFPIGWTELPPWDEPSCPK